MCYMLSVLIVSSFLGNVDALKLIYNKNRRVLHLVAKDCKFVSMEFSASLYNCLIHSTVTTPIFFAAQEGHFTALQYLHQKGKCDLASRSFDGMSPIHAACQNGHLEIMQVSVFIIQRTNSIQHHNNL